MLSKGGPASPRCGDDEDDDGTPSIRADRVGQGVTVVLLLLLLLLLRLLSLTLAGPKQGWGDF